MIIYSYCGQREFYYNFRTESEKKLKLCLLYFEFLKELLVTFNSSKCRFVLLYCTHLLLNLAMSIPTDYFRNFF